MCSAAAQPALTLDAAGKFVLTRAPGLLLAGALAHAANRLAPMTAFSPFLWASLIGIGVGNVLRALSPWSRRKLQTGISFAKTRLLRAGIVLYGAKLTVQKLALTGVAGVLADIFTVRSG